MCSTGMFELARCFLVSKAAVALSVKRRESAFFDRISRLEVEGSACPRNSMLANDEMEASNTEIQKRIVISKFILSHASNHNEHLRRSGEYTRV